MERFWAKVARSSDDGCWEWTAAKHPRGYGKFGLDGAWVLAHRVAYELLVGPIPADLVIDHVCENASCVNPAHLEVVPQRVNALRGRGVGAINEAKTHCRQGHPFDTENTLRTTVGGRRCRTCQRAAKARWEARRNARA